MATEFLNALKDLQDYLKSGAKSILSSLDRMSYGMLVDCLKSEDPEAVKEAMDQLVKEGRPVSIAPIYLVAVAHPVPWVRQKAEESLSKVISKADLEKLTAGKDTKEAVKVLVDKYGHFRK